MAIVTSASRTASSNAGKHGRAATGADALVGAGSDLVAGSRMEPA
jgi:hypothetical protein